MLKIYYLVLMIIIGLVAWLVTDFARNSAEARDIINSISSPVVRPNPPVGTLPPPPPFPQGNLDEIFKPRVEVIVAPPPVAPTSTFNYIVTGTIIGPDGPVAFIVNPTKNEERICKIGAKIDEWEVIEIVHESVTFKDKNGNIKTIPVQKQWGGAKGGKVELPPEIANIPGAEDIFRRVMSGTEPSEQVEKSIEAIVASLPPDYVKGIIKQWTNISEEDMPKDDTKLGEYAKNLFKVVQGKPIETGTQQSLENILFAIRVNPDNSPIAPQATFKPGDRRVYACFPNQGALKGLAKAVHRWTNKTTKEVIKLETKPVDPNAPYNFIWVEKREGWSDGEYEVEILNAQTLGKIAGGKFNVAP